MKTTPSIEAARDYLCYFLVFPVNQHEKWELLHRKHRLWLGTKSKKVVHICKPTNLLHYINGDTSVKKTDFIGEVVDGSYWHTKEISYRCHACHKKFTGGPALAIKLGIQDKEKFE